MKITDRIKNFINRNNTALSAENEQVDKRINEKANEIEKLYIEKKENGEENPINDTVEKIMQIIQNNRDPVEERKLLTELIERKNISDQLVERTAIEFSKKEDIPNEVIVEAINNAETDIPDNTIRNIVEKGAMNIQDNLDLIQQMHDQEKQKQAEQKQLELQRQEKQRQIEQQRKKAKNKLEKIYAKVKEMKDTELSEQIVGIKDKLTPENINDDIYEVIKNIIAQKIAEDYYDDSKKIAPIYTLSKVIPTGEMIEIDIATLVQKKYDDIVEERINQENEEEKKKKKHRFVKREFKKIVLNELGRQVGIEYDKTGIINIPQSKQLSQMTKDEKKYLIETVKKHTANQLKKEDMIDIYRQINNGDKEIQKIDISKPINSENAELQKKENEIINLIKQIPIEKKDRIIDILNKMILDQNKLETIEMLNNTGVLKKLGNMPKDKRQKTIGAISNAVNKMPKYKVAKNTPQIKGARFSGKPTIDGESR